MKKFSERISGIVPKRFLAFTLAEVLIALTIIGVVAALTVPTMITNYEKKVTVAKLQKAYSEISQAISMAQGVHGVMSGWDFADYPDSRSRNTDFFTNYIMANMRVTKKCIPSNSECWADDIYTLDNVRAHSYLQNSDSRVSFVTSSGYSVFGWLHGTGTAAGAGGWFYVDVNGPNNKPNRLGRDVFAFIVSWSPGRSGTTKVGFFPAGLSIYSKTVTREDLLSNPNGIVTDTGCLCEKDKGHSRAGDFCTGVIALDGWKIKDDYPW